MKKMKRRCKFFDYCPLADSTSRTCTQNGGGDYCGYFRFRNMKKPTQCPHNLSFEDTMKKYLYLQTQQSYTAQTIVPDNCFLISPPQNTPIRPENNHNLDPTGTFSKQTSPPSPVPPIYVSSEVTPNQAFLASSIRPENAVAAVTQLLPENHKKDELKADHALKQLGVTARAFYFFENVRPFYAVTIVDADLARSALRSELDRIFSGRPFEGIVGPATLLRKELRDRGIYGVAICNYHDIFSYQRGRTIAKGRLGKYLKTHSHALDDPPRPLTEQQRFLSKEWYKKNKRYFQV